METGLLLQSFKCSATGNSSPRVAFFFNCFMFALSQVQFSSQRPAGMMKTSRVRLFNHLTPNDHYSGRTAPPTSKRCILYIYSTSIDTEYFKHDMYSPFFSLQNAVCFIILMYLVHVLFTFYIQVC